MQIHTDSPLHHSNLANAACVESKDAEAGALPDEPQVMLLLQDIEKMAMEDIRDLAQTIKAIREHFRSVSATLDRFGTPTLLQTWRKCFKKFNRIIKRSQICASEASSILSNYEHALTNVDPEQLPAVKCKILDLIERLKVKSEEVGKIEEVLGTLSDDIDLFGSGLKSFQSTLKEENNRLARDLKSINDNLRTLSQPKKTDIQGSSSWSGVLCAVAGGAVGGALGIWGLSRLGAPLWRAFPIAVIAAALGYGVYWLYVRQKSGDEDQRLDGARAHVEGVKAEVRVIHNIWKAIEADMHELLEHLKIATGVELRGVEDLSLSRKTYQRLSECLRLYGRGVDILGDD